METIQQQIAVNKKEETNTSEIKSLKISVRVLEANDIISRKLPKGTTGLVITAIDKIAQ